MALTNRYANPCSSCTKHVPVGEGFIKGPPWKTYCKECFDVIDPPKPLGIKVEQEGVQILFSPTGFLGGDLFNKYRTALAGSTWNPNTKKNSAPLQKALKMVQGLREAGFLVEIHPDVAASLQAASVIRKTEITETNDRASKIDQELQARGLSLFPFQKTGIKWLASRTSALLADEMGLGKSVQTLIALPTAAPVVVVGPAVAKGVWKREIKKWRPDLKVTVLQGKGNFRWATPGEVVVVNYDILPEESDSAPEGTVLVADEAHALKGGVKTQRGRRFRGLSEKVEKSNGRVWLLTATPLLNKAPELWAVLQAANLAKEAFSSWDNFLSIMGGYKTRYALSWGHPDTTRAQECIRKVSLRRIRTEVLPELPTKTFVTQEVSLSDHARKALDKLVEKVKKQTPSIWEQILEGKVYNPSLDVTAYDEALETIQKMMGTSFSEMSHARMLLAKAKIPTMLEIVEDYEEQNEPLIVFSSYREPIDTLAQREGWAVITGDTSPEERTRIEDEFQKGNLKGVGATIKAGGVAITLTRANHALFVDQEWTPALNSQAEDRLCILEGQKVLTRYKGYIPIEDVIVGEEVLTIKGRWRPVTAIASRQHRKLLTEIKYTRFFEPLITTHDHKVFVKKGKNSPNWVPAHTVLPGDFLVFPRTKETTSTIETLEIPEFCKHSPTQTNNWGATQKNGRFRHLPKEVPFTEEVAALLGWYIAEGSSSTTPKKGRFVSFAGHENERTILERIKGILKSWGVNSTIYTNKKSKGIELRGYSIELAKWFKNWFGHRAQNKIIPPLLMDLPKNLTSALLEGYLTGDGYFRKEQQSWVTASNVLNTQLLDLLTRCGYMVGVTKRKESVGKTTKSKRPYWVGCFTKKGNPSNKNLKMSDDLYVYHPVKKVSTYQAKRGTAFQKVYDLQVQEDESFVVGQALVHNCRIGQTKAVMITTLVADHPLDERVYELLNTKRNVINASVEAARVDKEYEVNTDDQNTVDFLSLAKEFEEARIQEALKREKHVQEAKERAEAAEIIREEIKKAREERRMVREDLRTVNCRGPQTPQETWALQALLSLSDMDPDKANEQNNVGFNKPDSYTGHHLARASVFGLSDAQWQEAVELCKKYRRQVGSCPV